MNKKIIAAQFLNLGSILQNQAFPELFKKYREHNIILPYIEAAIISCYKLAILLNPNFSEAHYKLGRLF
ncbi:MAG: hypothetical protein ACFB2X_17940, partial [Rivularia sp. (in: cyanobacteria)]